MRGSGDFIWGGGGAANAPPTVRSTCGTFWPKNGSQPHISPRLRCFNRKITQKLCATCITRHLFWLVISPSCCSRQGPPLWNWGKFDHFGPLPTRLNVIWLKKVVPNLPFSYLRKVTPWVGQPLLPWCVKYFTCYGSLWMPKWMNFLKSFKWPQRKWHLQRKFSSPLKMSASVPLNVVSVMKHDQRKRDSGSSEMPTPLSPSPAHPLLFIHSTSMG